jgi:hypothetical protein
VIESGASVMESMFPRSLKDAGKDTEDEKADDNDAA